MKSSGTCSFNLVNRGPEGADLPTGVTKNDLNSDRQFSSNQTNHFFEKKSASDIVKELVSVFR